MEEWEGKRRVRNQQQEAKERQQEREHQESSRRNEENKGQHNEQEEEREWRKYTTKEKEKEKGANKEAEAYVKETEGRKYKGCDTWQDAEDGWVEVAAVMYFDHDCQDKSQAQWTEQMISKGFRWQGMGLGAEVRARKYRSTGGGVHMKEEGMRMR